MKYQQPTLLLAMQRLGDLLYWILLNAKSVDRLLDIAI